MMSERERLTRECWSALSQGDLEAIEHSLAPDARWHAVEDGPWNCEDRRTILRVLADNRASGRLAGEIETVTDLERCAVVGFRPRHAGDGGWPLDDGIRYVVVSTRDGLICELKGCPDRAGAFAYAGRAQLA